MRDGDGCRLAFTQFDGRRGTAAMHVTGWEVYLERLDAHLAGGFLSEALMRRSRAS